MKKMSCKHEALLSALKDGELTPEQGSEVRRHLASCETCRKRFEALQKADTMIREMEQIEPSADFDRTFWQRLDELGKKPSPPLLRFAAIGRWPAIAAGFTAVLLAVLVLSNRQEAQLTPDEVFIAENMELLQDYDMIDQLDMLEQWDAIESIKEAS